MPRWLRGLLIGLVTGGCGVALALTPVGAGFERAVGLPWLFKVRGPIEPPPNVAVVAIDGSTGRALDLPKLPRDWPRTVHARLTDALIERGASVIVFDFDFSRPKPPEEDGAFARAIADAGRVVLLQRLAGRRQPVERADGSPGGWIWIEDALPPSEPLALAARALGPFPLPKMGQAAFEFWSYKDSAGDAPTTAALALQLYALDVHDRWLAALDEAGTPGLDGLPARADDLPDAPKVRALMQNLRYAFQDDPGLRERLVARIAADAGADDGRAAKDERLIRALSALYAGAPHRYLNFYGPPGTIRTIPYQSLLDENGRPGPDLTDTVVFVGYSDLYDPEQPDRFYTVFTGSDGVDLSGVEIMATAFANLLTDRSLRIAEPVTALPILAAFGLVVGAGAYLLPAMVGVPVVFALAGLYAAGAQWAFNGAGLWLPVANPVLVQLPFALLVGLMGQYLLGRRHQRRMSEAISYYVPESIVRDLTEGGHAADAVNKVVYGTCLATDMSGFSTIAEKMPPNELASFMNAYFDALAQALKRHAVDVTEFHADTIMCAWTAAGPTAAVRRKAALAALDLVEAIERFGEARGGLRLSARIGLQDGHFYLGHTGGGGRLAYSILGDPANTAARLESLNKHLGTRVLAAGSVVEGADDVLLARPLGSFRLMGRDDATAVVEVVARREAATADQLELCAAFSRALDAFRARRWSEAAGLFEALAASHPRDGAALLHLDRARHYAAEGAEDDDDPTVIRMGAK